MNLEIKKDKRSTNYIKMPYGISNKEAKKEALKDISDCCGENKFYSKNYLIIESTVLKNCKNTMFIISIDTTIY